MMKTSFSTLACPDWDLTQILQAAATYGYDGVELRVISRELDLWNLPDFQPSALAATRNAIQDHGLVVASMGSSACFHSSDPLERQRNFDSALRMAELAAGLGAPSVRVFGDRIQPGNTRTQTAGWIADSLNRLAEKMQPSGVEVWLETHGDFATVADVNNVLAQLDDTNVGIIWDPANAFEQSGEAPLISPRMASHIRHVHVKDMKRDTQGALHYVATGEGDFPFQTMFASLAEIGFDGFASFEWEKLWHPELAGPDTALPHFIKWWKSREVS
ncbi:MAG TPA: sugar phosphate isomerase/epimerase family protein [Acidobacteriaceae bacterium]|nr:sugar phosphate isomerase/epimerase family protein [Acidobacteriaceae bacterium]